MSRPLYVKLSGSLLLMAMPIMASAGVFSFVSSLFSEDKAVRSLPVDNVQTIELLQADVSPNPELSRGGAEIAIVDGTALMAEPSPSSDEDGSIHRPASDQISTYVVHDGDNLSGIAKMFGVSVNTIVWTNGLKSGQALKEGQVLVILPISGVKHTVKKGDTLASIAKKYKGDAEEIQSYNNVGAELAIGSVIIIPDGEIIAEPKKAAPRSSVRLGASGVPSYSGFYQRPISGGVRTQGIHGFNGVDLAAPVGTPIYAAAAGQVVISRSGAWNGGYGNYVVISHSNGTQTLYSHNSSNIVSQGESVAQGQVIGYVGNTGKSTGPHVHFEVRGAKNPF